MYRDRYLEEQREISRKNGSTNWFKLEQMKFETVREPEDEVRKDEIFADVDKNIFWYD